MGPRIFGWAADGSGCCYYRIQTPLAEYARRGGTATWSTTLTPRDREEADIIIGQRVCPPRATRLWQEMCCNGRALMVLELDDDLFHIDPSNTIAYQAFTPEHQANLAENIRAADVVTVSTEHLAEVVRPLNPNVVVVPNRIPGWLLEHNRPRAEQLTVGWAGSSSHTMDWEEAGPRIGRWLRRNPRVSAHLIGARFPSMRNWPAEQTRFTSWVPSVDNYYRMLDFDIGLAPLKPHLFNRSKSAIKALEYAALGIPVVASEFGPYETFVRHGETGYLVRREHEWARYLRTLAEDEQARAEISQAARKLASEHTIEGNLESWLDAWQIPSPDKAAA